ncbi:MAG: pyridoxal-phosphate dependent enzyme [Deltaproteobacteria bacterium]|nr:pyridoxal-phosphate dependent enzyme [Deltaproteobacteria bacterium]
MSVLHRARTLDRVLDAIGKTPLVRLARLKELRDAPDVKVYAKLELANPGGSVKDRAARQMILDALADGRLSREKILVDSTSGNTGVAYAMIGAALGLKIELVMPRNVTEPRKRVARAYGAKLTFSDPMEGSDGAIREVRKMVEADPDRYFYPDQYSNPSNPGAHYLGTGVELLDDLGRELTHFVAGLGTSGTMMGTTRRLKEAPFPIRCVAVEPDQPLHGLEGLKHMASSLVPAIYDPQVPDEIMPVCTEEGWDMADRLAREEGLHVGHSSGANVWAAVQLAKQHVAAGKPACIVAIVCDRGDRYFAPMKWERSYVW